MLSFALQGAVMLEMARVTEASMDAVVADRDAWIRCGNEIDRLTTRREELRTAGLADEVDRLDAQIGQLRARADATDLGLIAAKSDAMQFGSSGGPQVFGALARSVAHMAHAPGGITAFGLHWCRSGHNGIPADPGYCCALELAREQVG
jgi:hypothetical protein